MPQVRRIWFIFSWSSEWPWTYRLEKLSVFLQMVSFVGGIDCGYVLYHEIGSKSRRILNGLKLIADLYLSSYNFNDEM